VCLNILYLICINIRTRLYTGPAPTALSHASAAGPALCIVVFVRHRAGPVYSHFSHPWHRASPVYRHFLNIHYPWNYADNNVYFNEFSLDTQWNNNDRLHTWLVQTIFNMGTLDLDNHHNVFLAADRSLDLTCSGLAEPNSQLARISTGVINTLNIKSQKALFVHFCNGNSYIILNTLQPFSSLNVFIKNLSSFVKGAMFARRNYVTNDAAALARNI